MCPWHEYRQDWLSFCEEDVCSIIRHPSDAYTMIVMLIVAVVIWRQCKGNLLPLRSLAFIGLVMAVGSFIYHATGTFFGQVIDVGAMLLFSSFAIGLNAWRIYHLKRATLVWLFILLNSLTLLLLIQFHSIGIYLFAIEMSLIIALELILFEKKLRPQFRPLICALGWFALGQLFWHLDFWGILCWPNNHILTGHGIWHMACGVGFYFYFKFAAQFFHPK